MSETMCEAAAAGAKRWQHYFNAGDAAGCASCFERSATLIIKPHGTFYGRNSIEGFWNKQLDNGFGDLEYTDFVVMQIDQNIAIVTGEWSMENATGKIASELWVRQSDGLARLREAHLQIIQSPQTNLASLQADRKAEHGNISR